MSRIKKIVKAVLAVGLLCTLTGCASCDRFKKTWDSNVAGGLDREVIVYSATGEEVWQFRGKIDVEYTDGRVLFDDENGKRHVIYFPNGTVIINEV